MRTTLTLTLLRPGGRYTPAEITRTVESAQHRLKSGRHIRVWTANEADEDDRQVAGCMRRVWCREDGAAVAEVEITDAALAGRFAAFEPGQHAPGFGVRLARSGRGLEIDALTWARSTTEQSRLQGRGFVETTASGVTRTPIHESVDEAHAGAAAPRAKPLHEMNADELRQVAKSTWPSGAQPSREPTAASFGAPDHDGLTDEQRAAGVGLVERAFSRPAGRSPFWQ